MRHLRFFRFTFLTSGLGNKLESKNTKTPQRHYVFTPQNWVFENMKLIDLHVQSYLQSWQLYLDRVIKLERNKLGWTLLTTINLHIISTKHTIKFMKKKIPFLLAKTISWFTNEKLSKNRNNGSARMLPYSKINMCEVEPFFTSKILLNIKKIKCTPITQAVY